MMYFACLLVGLISGGAGGFYLHSRLHERKAGPPDISGARWEKSKGVITPLAIRHLRRHYPTHDLMTNVRFLDLVQARGAINDGVEAHSGYWTVGVVMIDKRTGDGSRIILWHEDEDRDQKSWILKRAGYKVHHLQRDAEESELLNSMAA